MYDLRTALVVTLSLALIGGCAKNKKDTESPYGGTADTTADDQDRRDDAMGGTTDDRSASTGTGMGSDVYGTTPRAEHETMPSAQQEGLATRSNRIGVRLNEDLGTLCKVESTKAFFEFDSADLLAVGSTRLKELADCLKKDEYKDAKIQVVGHTDPQGTAAYNKDLGLDRAQSVADYLAQQGIDRNRIVVITRGEMAAHDQQPTAWPFDRRVDIELTDASRTALLGNKPKNEDEAGKEKEEETASRGGAGGGGM